MARGESGRIVLEIDPSHKDDLYSALTKDGLTLKDWFLKQADEYLRGRNQLQLFESSSVAEKRAVYGVKKPDGNASAKPKLSGKKGKSK